MKITKLLTSAALALAAVGSAAAATYNFQPNPVDLNDLDHYYAYTWGINNPVPAGQTIVGASISISNIRNWRNESNALFIHLLDSASTGVTQIWDSGGSSTISDYFSGQGILLTTFVDSTFVNQQFTYNFTNSQLATLIAYISNGSNVAFGFDPDCHYFNDGVTFTITTTTTPPGASGVPDSGSTLILLGLGFLGLAGLKRRMAA